MVAVNGQTLLPQYDDGPDVPCARDKERAFRQGFLEEARRIAHEWTRAADDGIEPDSKPMPIREILATPMFDPMQEVEAARALRSRVRGRFTVYATGRKTHCLGYHKAHIVPAARLRGRHHALVYAIEPWLHGDTADTDICDPARLYPWLRAVEHWASRPIRTNRIIPPPRPVEIEVHDAVPLTPPASAPKPSMESAGPPPFERVDVVCLANVTPQPVRWLWPSRIALGKLSLIAGEPGLGKSFLTLDMAARVSRGDAWPCSGGSAEPGGVVLLSAEDDVQDTIRPRLDAARADCRRIAAIQAVRKRSLLGSETSVPFSLIDHLHLLEATIRATADCRLVIIDPVSAFLGSTDSHNNSEVRGVLAPLAEMAARHGVAIVAVTHLNKGGGSALNRVIGSIAFTAAARAAYVVTRDEDDPARRLMLPAKNNLGCDENGFAYRLEGEPTPHIEWEPTLVAMSADEAVGMDRKRGPEPDARRDAEAWLLDYLAAGPRAAKDVYADAAGDGHTKDTIRRAKAALAIKVSKDGYQGAWTWMLPGSGPLMTADDGDSKGTAKGGKGGPP